MLFSSARRKVFVLAALACVAAVMSGRPTVAKAEVWHWDFNVAYDGVFDIADADVWAFKPNADTLKTFNTPVVTDGLSRYDWTYDITEVYVQLNGIIWQPTGGTYGTSGFDDDGSLPIVLASEVIDESEGGQQIIKTTLDLYVGTDGKAHFDITDTIWGKYPLGAGFANVTGIAVAGSMDVSGVPEPTGIVLLILGGLPLGLIALRRRRR